VPQHGATAIGVACGGIVPDLEGSELALQEAPVTAFTKAGLEQYKGLAAYEGACFIFAASDSSKTRDYFDRAIACGVRARIGDRVL
jgi:hypothetical protein